MNENELSFLIDWSELQLVGMKSSKDKSPFSFSFCFSDFCFDDFEVDFGFEADFFFGTETAVSPVSDFGAELS